MAIFLDSEGLKKDDRIAICSENNAQFCITVCAAFYLGVTVCPLNPFYTERELRHALNISKPKYIFISVIGAKNTLKVAPEFFPVPKLIMLNESMDIKLPTINGLTSNIVVNDMFRACPVDVDNHVAVISCSSGTTGMPKGVMLTDKNFLTVIRSIAASLPDTSQPNATSLALLPFFHAYAFTVMLVRLIFGNKNVILPHFEEKMFLRAIEKYKIEILTIVPPLMVFLAKHPIVDKYDLSSIKEIWYVQL